MEERKKSPFDVIAGYSVNEGLGEALRQNEAYIAVQKKIDEQTALLDGQNLTREQRQMIDGLVDAYTENGALYGRVTYQKGFRDCGSLLWEMGLIRAA